MKVIKAKSGNKAVRISRQEWQNIGKTAGWIKEADIFNTETEDSGGLNAWRIAVELTIPVERAVDNQAALADFKKILNSVFGGDTGLMHYHILELPKKVADV